MCKSKAFQDKCDFKNKCNEVTGFGANDDKALENFLDNMEQLVDEHAKRHQKKDEAGDERNPNWNEFYMKWLAEAQS